jgi:hypothetical protein
VIATSIATHNDNGIVRADFPYSVLHIGLTLYRVYRTSEMAVSRPGSALGGDADAAAVVAGAESIVTRGSLHG